ncbi:MAG TPA: hypothetical protein PKH16_10675 [Aequorivita sp.]|nr:hypothetical protein [Aequorivita sp.]
MKYAKKVVEERRYSYIFYFIFLFTLVFGLLSYTQNEMEKITAKYLPKHESVQNLPLENRGYVSYDEGKEKDPVRYFFLASIVIISSCLFIFSFLTYRENYKKGRNPYEQWILILWSAINFFIVVKLLNDYWSNDFLESKFWSYSYMLFLTIPLLSRVYFGAIQGNLIEESKLEMKKRYFTNTSKSKDLKNLLDNNLISQEQFEIKSKEIKNDIIKDRIENDKDFMNIKFKLNKAVDSNLLSKEEAENKIKEYREKMLIKFSSQNDEN